MSEEVTRTVIAADVVVRGDIEGPTDLHVEGRILGKVTVAGVVLEESAEIDGPVTAEAAVIAGTVTGPVIAKAVHVKATARIEGDVSYATLQIEAGARLSGRLIITDESADNVAKLADSASRGSKVRPEADASSQELVRMAARLRRAVD